MDKTNGSQAESIVRAAYRQQKLRANSRAVDNFETLILRGQAYKPDAKWDELLAYSVERAITGRTSPIVSAIYQEFERRYGKNG